MSDYIRREDAVDTIKKNFKYLPGYMNATINYIKELPSADVVPAKYGEWISTPEMWGEFDVRYYCSKCGKSAIINNSERYVLSDYCPHCGAIMDNKRGNESG